MLHRHLSGHLQAEHTKHLLLTKLIDLSLEVGGAYYRICSKCLVDRRRRKGRKRRLLLLLRLLLQLLESKYE